MTSSHSSKASTTTLDFLVSSSKMASLIYQYDWNSTPLGHLEKWHPHLHSAVTTCLATQSPVILYLGEDATIIHNDAATPILFNSHPAGALGLPAAKAQPELWPLLAPFVKEAIETKSLIKTTNILYLLSNQIHIEEHYISTTLSPIKSYNGAVSGVMATLLDNTYQVVNKRRLELMQKIAQGTTGKKTCDEVFEAAAKSIAEDNTDIAFSLFYQYDSATNHALLKTRFGAPEVMALECKEIALDDPATHDIWNFNTVIKTKKLETLVIGHLNIKALRWNMIVQHTSIVPLILPCGANLFGFLVLGICPVREYDQSYRTFHASLAFNIVSALEVTLINQQLQEEQAGVDRLLSKVKTFCFSGEETSTTSCAIGLEAKEELPSSPVAASSKITQVEETLENMENRFKNLASLSAFGIFHTNAQGELIYSNQKHLDLLGIKPEERSIESWRRTLHYDDRERVYKLWRDAVEHQTEYKADYRLVHKDGTIVWVLSQAVPVRNTKGQVMGYVGNITDVTDLKKVQEERRQEAEQYRQLQEHFTSYVCHEIRNPLAGIRGCIDELQLHNTALGDLLESSHTQGHILKICYPPLIKMSQEYKNITDALLQCTMQQQAIVDDVLDLTKLEIGKVSLNLVDCNLSDSVEEVLRMLNTVAKKQSINLIAECSLSTEQTKVHTDPIRLRQILLNFISNAIHFTAKKTSGLKQVTVRARPSPKGVTTPVVLFEIEDTGIGMSQEEQKRIFNRFTQASAKTYQTYGGSGLGLSISKNLIELMQGTINLQSREGEGTTVTIELPFQPAKQLTAAPPTEHSLSFFPQRQLKVLVVEDNKINQKLLVQMLKRAHYQCLSANDGQEALDALAKHPDIDAILMDIQMPVMDGLAATQQIRAQEKATGATSPIPIIGVSADALQSQRELALKTGMTDYLVKPYDAKLITEKINFYTKATPKPATAPPAEAMSFGL